MLRSLLPAALLLFTPFAWCDEADHYNRVAFQSAASREVNNDLLTARMSVEINDKLPGRIAQQINATLNDALKKAAAFSAVKVSTGNQNTEAIYDKNKKFIGYRGHAELNLESRDFESAGKLIASLQEKMQLAGIDFRVATVTQKQIETDLIEEAIDAFKKRAETVRVLLNGNSYKLVRLDINHSGHNQSRENFRSRMLFDANNAPLQNFSGGQSEISGQVSGTIEIIP